jgi:hypothetical protein
MVKSYEIDTVALPAYTNPFNQQSSICTIFNTDPLTIKLALSIDRQTFCIEKITNADCYPSIFIEDDKRLIIHHPRPCLSHDDLLNDMIMAKVLNRQMVPEKDTYTNLTSIRHLIDKQIVDSLVMLSGSFNPLDIKLNTTKCIKDLDINDIRVRTRITRYICKQKSIRFKFA